MARGGGKRRTYVRDSNGRFASTPGGAARKAAQSTSGKKGTLAARTSLKKSRSKLAAKDSADQSLQGTLSKRAQKGAVTRGRKRLAQTKKDNTIRLKRVQGVSYGKSETKNNDNMVQTGAVVQAKGIKRKRPAAGGSKGDKGSKPKTVVNIKRAAPGGEYGPDGHFYSGGSWMPLGKFKGGGKQSVPVGSGKGSDVKQSGKDDGSGRQGGFRGTQKKERPRLQPAESTPLPSLNISERGRKNMIGFFRNGFYTAYKKGRDGYPESQGGGWLADAALAARIPPKAVGSAITRLRRMAKDKKEFDAAVAWERDLARRREVYGYEEMKRGGYLPRSMTANQYSRAQQLTAAIGEISKQRRDRPDNRRTGFEEYIWVMNNILGTREKRAPRRSQAALTAGDRVRVRGPRLNGVMRPVSSRKLIAAGGSRWQKDAFDRIYFNQPNTGKVFYDRNTRTMVSQPGDKQGAALAKRMQRAGRRLPTKAWKTVKQGRRKPKP